MFPIPENQPVICVTFDDSWKINDVSLQIKKEKTSDVREENRSL